MDEDLQIERVHATGAQRAGMVLAVIEAVVLGVAAALHLGAKLAIGGTTYSAPFLYTAGIVEAVLALALLLAVILPGGGGVRVGRVMAAQILVIIGVFVGQVAQLRGTELATMRAELVYGGTLVLALLSIILLASPAMRARTLTSR
jgi:hypothetical protein